jgi:hypothetical protein
MVQRFILKKGNPRSLSSITRKFSLEGNIQSSLVQDSILFRQDQRSQVRTDTNIIVNHVSSASTAILKQMTDNKKGTYPSCLRPARHHRLGRGDLSKEKVSTEQAELRRDYKLFLCTTWYLYR